MSIENANRQDIQTLAATLGYRISAQAADQYAVLVNELLDGYKAVDDVEPVVPEVRWPRSRQHPPGPISDPHNAWYLRTSIKGARAGALSGQTIAVKDSIMIADLPTAAGSRMLDGYLAEFDATIVTRVLDAGAEIVGKTNCEYFCLSGGSHTSDYGPTHNPHRRGYTAGGSSSGSAVAVATGAATMALGGDQAGSIRVPASFTGCVGLKPTYGLVPYTGITPLEPFVDHAGLMAASAADNALLLGVVAGPDGYDSRQPQRKPGDYLAALERSAKGLRVGVLAEGFGQDGGEPDVDTAVREAGAIFQKLGAHVTTVSVPLHAAGTSLFTAIIVHGLSRTVVDAHGFPTGRDDLYPTGMIEHLFANRSRRDELPSSIKLWTMLDRYLIERHGPSYYGRAVNGARRLRQAYDKALADLDVLIMPTTPQKAQPIPEADATVAEYCARTVEMFGNTCPFDISHHPAMSVQCGWSGGLPVGMMLVAKHFDEASIFRAAHAYEQRDN